MSKRIKRVFSNGEQVLHLWANQSQDDARSSNVFFDGIECFSYGHHYLLGKLHAIKGKYVAAIINSTKYSVTTDKHQRWAINSVAHLAHLRGNPNSIPETIEENKEILTSQLDAFFKRRSFYQSKINEEFVIQSIKNYNNFCKVVGHKQSQIKINKSLLNKMQSHIDKCIKRQQELNSPENREKKRLALLKKSETEIAIWRQGGPLTNAIRSLSYQLVRVRNGLLETSRGASVPLVAANQCLEKILKNKIKAGQQVGNFTFNGFDGENIKIGCHTFKLSEVVSVLKSE